MIASHKARYFFSFFKGIENMEKEKKENRGGARTGSGRKSVKDKRKNFLIMLNDKERANLDKMRGSMGASEFIRQKLGL